MKIKRDTPYKVTKGNTDGCLIPGMALYISSEDGFLVTDGGFLTPDELTDEVMDFEAEEMEGYFVGRSGGSDGIEKLPEGYVKVIRCKDCASYEYRDDNCTRHGVFTSPDDYCSFARRK